MLNEDYIRQNEQLKKVGWEADSDNLRYFNGTLPQKERNIVVAEWQTDSNFIDYALFVGMKMIAVIEVEANYKGVSAVIDCKRKDYARNICDADKAYQFDDWRGFKVPFVFASKGRPYNQQLETKSGIWFLNLRHASNAPKALRSYQIKAVKAIEKAVLDEQKNILIAMATGTGKTRTVLGMIYRFLKPERFRRIFFLSTEIHSANRLKMFSPP